MPVRLYSKSVLESITLLKEMDSIRIYDKTTVIVGRDSMTKGIMAVLRLISYECSVVWMLKKQYFGY